MASAPPPTSSGADPAASPDVLPLAGLRVLELAQGIAGPFAGKWLAALGADVIKVEPPAGDPIRAAGPWPGDNPDDETSGLHLYLNANKRGITLNLETSDGREILRELARTADLVTESFTPGFLDGLSVGFDALRAERPALVMVSITPFGQTGPWADFPATELTLFALAGQLGLTGSPDREPLKNGGPQPSYQAGLNAFTAAVMAIYAAQVQGEGAHVDLSMRETFASMIEVYSARYGQTGEDATRMGNALNAIWGIYPCADGFAGVCVLQRNYEAFVAATALEELREPRFADPAQRLEHEDELQAVMYGWFADKTEQQVFDLGRRHKVPMAYVAKVDALAASEQLRLREFFTLEDHPRAGRLQYPGRLWLSDGHTWRRDRAPELGEHNVDVLHGELGYDREDLVRLRALDAI